MNDNSVPLEIQSSPGIQRDGTNFDRKFYQDGEWVRFQRGRPSKIGGYRSISSLVTGPVRNIYIDSRLSTNSIHTFSQWGVQRLQVDDNGIGGAIYERTPVGFVPNVNYSWSSDAMYSSTGGTYTALIAAATPDINEISSDVPGNVYSGDVTTTSPLTVIQDGAGDILVSGGCVVLQPFLFVYGSNGLIRNSNANDFSAATGWTTGGANFANSANVCGTKIVKGLAMRGGTGAPSGLFWSLDSLIRVTFANNSTILWRYDTISDDISVLSKSGIIEYNGIYFWVGVDRFFTYNGVVQELPNDMNFNYFFDNINMNAREKVFGMKIPQYGEIWWFYPRGSATECNDAIIYNVKYNIWYDATLERNAGFPAGAVTYPVMTGPDGGQDTTYLSYSALSGVFLVGDTVTGATTGATGLIVRSLSGILNVIDVTGAVPFANTEIITATNGATGMLIAAAQDQELDSLWQHEFGVNRIVGQDVTAIRSYIETTNFSLPAGIDGMQATDAQTRVIRVEPDFIQSGEMNMYVNGRSYAKSTDVLSQAYPFVPETEHIDPREQRRICSLIFESNTIDGSYEMGKILTTIGPGDKRG